MSLERGGTCCPSEATAWSLFSCQSPPLQGPEGPDTEPVFFTSMFSLTFLCSVCQQQMKHLLCGIGVGQPCLCQYHDTSPTSGIHYGACLTPTHGDISHISHNNAWKERSISYLLGLLQCQNIVFTSFSSAHREHQA